MWYDGSMSIKTSTITSSFSLSFVSVAEFDLVAHVCNRFHRDAEEFVPHKDTPFLTEDIDLGERKCTGVPSEIRGIQESYSPSSWDYLEYGDGMEEDTEELEEMIELLADLNISHRRAIRKLALDTRGRIDVSKTPGYTGTRFSWADAWEATKESMRGVYAEIRANDKLSWKIKGELRARSSESTPWNTPYMTSDLCGPSRVDSDVTCYEQHSDLDGAFALSNRGDITSPPPKNRRTASPRVIVRRKK